MTNVVMEKRGMKYEITIHGHAGYRPGNDIVCAAVSMLTYTLAQVLKDMQEEGKLDCEITLDCGNAEFLIYPWNGEELETVLQVIKTGFELLVHKYPCNVHLKCGWEKNTV